MHYMIKDTEFEEFLKIFKKLKRIHKTDIKKLRLFIEAIYYACRTGCQWRMLPYFYGDWRAVHKRFKYWADKGVWQQLFEGLRKDPDMEYTMIDSTIIRANACAAGYKKNSQNAEALGRSCGGFSTKIHAICDALGLPLKFILTPGQRNDVTQAAALTEDISDTFLLADKGYDSDEFIESLKQKNCKPVIPPRNNRLEQREYDNFLYEDRNRVECFLAKLNIFAGFLLDLISLQSVFCLWCNSLER